MKKYHIKYIIYVAMFIATAVATFMSMNHEAEVTATMAMAEASLPVIMVETEDGQAYNVMHGYTANINEKLMTTDYTPISTSKKMVLLVDTYGELVEKISYVIRERDTGNLMEETEINSFNSQESRIRLEIAFRNYVMNNNFYNLEITLKTKKHESIRYFTTFTVGNDYGLSEKLAFVTNFVRNTYDPHGIDEVGKYLEPDKKVENNNYGNVNIHNSKAAVGFGDINPFVESNIIPSLYSIDEEYAIFTVDYTIGAENENGGYDTFLCHDYYRIRQTSRGIYLLDYARQAKEVFDGRNDLGQSGRIIMGIQPDSQVNYMASSNNDYVEFVNNGTLWAYCVSNNEFNEIFSFASVDSDNVRERFDNYDIEIVNVTNEGNSAFIVYGYMNRGEHEGQLGVSLFNYTQEDDTVREVAFIPIDVPFQYLKDNVGDILYMNDNNAFYILIDRTLYSIELTSQEVMTEIADLTPGSYYVSSDRHIIAYTVGGSLYDADSIRIFNMEKGTDKIIKAPSGDKIRPMGFIETDAIYGIAHGQDVSTTENGITTFPMYKVEIVDEEYQSIRTYEEPGIYVSNSYITGLRITLDRLKKEDNGGFSAISIDQLINKNENDNSNRVTEETISNTLKKNLVTLKLNKSFVDITKSQIKDIGAVSYSKNNSLSLVNSNIGEGKFYVTGFGSYQGSYLMAGEAVKVAADTYGTVTDCHNNIIWSKYKNNTAALNNPANMLGFGSGIDGARKAVESYLEGNSESLNRITVQGISLDNALCFVSQGYPVIARIGNGYAIIVAYNASEIQYIEVNSNQLNTTSVENMSNVIAGNGSVFEMYYRK